MDHESGFSLRDLLLKAIFVVAFILLLLWFFPMPNMKPVYDRIFTDNLETMKEAAKSYYTIDRLPSNVGDKVTMTLEEMQNKKLVLPFYDSEGKLCDSKASYVEVMKTDTEYVIKTLLSCSTKADYVIEHLGCYDICPDVCKPEQKEEPKEEQDKPTPSDVTYLYEYSKKISTQYSAWSAWSKDIIYVDADNIKFGCTELKCIEKSPGSPRFEEVGRHIQYGTKKIEHVVLYQIGSYKQEVCKKFNYMKYEGDTYRYTDWQYVGIFTYSSAPSDTLTEKYEFVGVDLDACKDLCAGTSYLKFKKYVRNAYKETGSGGIKVSCAEKEIKSIPIYGTKLEVTDAYEVIKVTRLYADVKYYRYKTRKIIKEAYVDKKWSYYNDKNLLNKGYKYTGKKKVK